MVNKFLDELRQQALIESIPIMDDDSLMYIAEFIANHNCQSVLEVGTAIGYSAITMCYHNPNLRVLSLEKDQQRYHRALKNIKTAEMEEYIEVVNCDARQYETNKMFDMILLDGPKAHNSELLNRYEKNLNKNGYFIIDDVYFHGFIDHPEIVHSPRLMKLVKKFGAFREEMLNNEDYICTNLNIGDGLLIAKKKENKDE